MISQCGSCGQKRLTVLMGVTVLESHQPSRRSVGRTTAGLQHSGLAAVPDGYGGGAPGGVAHGRHPARLGPASAPGRLRTRLPHRGWRRRLRLPRAVPPSSVQQGACSAGESPRRIRVGVHATVVACTPSSPPLLLGASVSTTLKEPVPAYVLDCPQNFVFCQTGGDVCHLHARTERCHTRRAGCAGASALQRAGLALQGTRDRSCHPHLH